jgi:hypothetical protein
MTPPIFCCRPPASRELAKRRRAPTEAGRRARRQRRCDGGEKALAIGIPRVKGGISAMAKKTAKGGKKKGGKKR